MKSKDSESRIIQVDDINIGENIRTHRLKSGLKQTEVVGLLQVHGVDIYVYSYNRIEKGTQNPTVSQLLMLAELLRCDMNALFYGIDSDKPNP